MPSPPITWLCMVPLSVRRRVPLSCVPPMTRFGNSAIAGDGVVEVRHQPVVLVAAERRAVVGADVQSAVVAEDDRRRAGGLEGRGVMIGVRVGKRRELAVQPPGLDASSSRRRSCVLRRGEVAADPDRVARGIASDRRGSSGCTSTAPWQMFMLVMPVDRVERDLRRVDAVGDPGLSAVRGAIDVAHLRCRSDVLE